MKVFVSGKPCTVAWMRWDDKGLMPLILAHNPGMCAVRIIHNGSHWSQEYYREGEDSNAALQRAIAHLEVYVEATERAI